MKRLAITLLSLACVALVVAIGPGKVSKIRYPGGKKYMFRVTLTDKVGTPFSLDEPSSYMSERALERRRRQGLAVDSTDLPVNPAYVRAVDSMGVEVVSRSRWTNTLLVRSGRKDRARALSALSCVADVKLVWTSPDSIAPASTRARHHDELNRWDDGPQGHYGVATDQIEMLNGVKLHDRGFTGRGMVIAVLDGGFMNVDLIPGFRSATILGCADFVVPRSDNVYKEMEHGTKVLSVMALNEPEKFVGVAPDASYWLLRCEDERTESLAEEDYWVAAAEFADSVGVDIISSSLCYHDFDDASTNYSYRHLDGHTSLASRAASMLAGKGIVLVNSAGNDGIGRWKKIGVPADASDVLSVGAVSPDRCNAVFSSVGPSADGRVKPDVMALGSPASVVTGRGTIVKDVGTSFSTPVVSGMVACLWQALRDKTALEIIDLVRDSGDNAASPDNIYGYGVPDFWKAYHRGRGGK